MGCVEREGLRLGITTVGLAKGSGATGGWSGQGLIYAANSVDGHLFQPEFFQGFWRRELREVQFFPLGRRIGDCWNFLGLRGLLGGRFHHFCLGWCFQCCKGLRFEPPFFNAVRSNPRVYRIQFRDRVPHSPALVKV